MGICRFASDVTSKERMENVYLGSDHVARTDPDDPSPRPTRRPRHDDPYVIVRDTAARDEGDDAATTSDPQPSQPPGSPRYHL
ncbi:hypothetical protein Tco_1277326 [Tanacetum coccineum]